MSPQLIYSGGYFVRSLGRANLVLEATTFILQEIAKAFAARRSRRGRRNDLCWLLWVAGRSAAPLISGKRAVRARSRSGAGTVCADNSAHC